jgi:hypothetical protein
MRVRCGRLADATKVFVLFFHERLNGWQVKPIPALTWTNRESLVRTKPKRAEAIKVDRGMVDD